MPKGRDAGRRTSRGKDEPARPTPQQADVERAIEQVVERLKPKLPKSGSARRDSKSKTRPPERLGRVREENGA